jgi:hypothetical protein
MGMQMRLLEALVDADPDAEGKAESPVEQPDQNEPAVDGFHEILPLSLGFETDWSRAKTPCKVCRPASQTRTR